MRRLRLSLVGTVILALLGGLGGAVVAQDEYEGSVTFTIESSEDVSEGPGPGRTYMVVMAKEASDPRMSGTWTEVWGCQEGSGFEACVASVRVENEGGTWVGRAEGFSHPSGMYDLTVFEGQGDYAGLWALRIVSASPTGDVEEGVIFEFDQPEQPELPAE